MKVIFTDQNNKRYITDGESGETLKDIAIKYKVPGILAECGGACACATCHVYVQPEWTAKLNSMDDMEDVMLDMTNDRRDTSRLGCQLIVSEALDGIQVTVADNAL